MNEVPELDPVIHAVARLRITSILAALGPGDSLAFTRLQAALDLTPGNLITHLRKLEEAGYVVSDKTGRGRNATTTLALTSTGRQAFEEYSSSLRSMLND